LQRQHPFSTIPFLYSRRIAEDDGQRRSASLYMTPWYMVPHLLQPVSNMPQLTEELWNKLWNAQNEREAARREELRQAVARSTPPLTADLVQALIHLNDRYTREIMREHKGFTLAERRTSYLTSLAIMEQCLQDLLAEICAFEAAALTEDSTLFDRNGDADLKRFERAIQKELFATANAAASLVDHARRVDKCQPIPNYKTKQIECFGTDGLHDFVIALRVMLHHLHIVEAGWNMTTSFSEGTKTASFTISRATIERVIASSPDRFDRPADAAMKTYVQAAPEQIDLRAVFLDYRARMARFHAWMKNVLESESLIALRDYDFVLREKVKSDKRMFWKAMMGNWLNWKKSPDPHNHIARYLTPEQLTEVYALPRNSKEQVDLVLRYGDKDGIVDDALRKQAYELFERSPPADPLLLKST